MNGTHVAGVYNVNNCGIIGTVKKGAVPMFLKKEYFCGWYFRCQSADQTIAFIPAIHKTGGRKSCSVQVITPEGVWNIQFPYEDYERKRKGLRVRIGGNYFGRRTLNVDLSADKLRVTGRLKFGEWTAIRYDIMGPFSCVPFMECRHSVYSMRHAVSGKLRVNGTDYIFENGLGYIEGDRGHSFPKEYAWTQCFFEGGSLMLSVAHIPVGPLGFTGIIGIVYMNGKEYRLATYLGAKLVQNKDGNIVVRQGKLTLTARLIEKNAQPLYAPSGGAMTRTIRESLECRAYYSFCIDGRTVLSFESGRAAFEYEYKNKNS